MSEQNQQLSELRIRNQCIAVFASMHLEQNPRIECTDSNVEFVFASELSFRQIKLLYDGPAGALIKVALDRNISYGKEKNHLINSRK